MSESSRNAEKMKRKKKMKNRSTDITGHPTGVSLLYTCTSKALGVSPAPDGCYPNYTTAEGCNALESLTTGAGNTGLVGVRSLPIAPATSIPVLALERWC